MNSHQTCDACTYWENTSGSNKSKDATAPRLADRPLHGRCHRNAPRPDDKGAGMQWPQTTGNDWCGEWKSKDQSL
jgi:hypothetical protein